VAVSTTWLKHLPARAAAVLTWAGLAAIVYSAFVFNAQTAYPGSLVAVPVVGAALIIAGGVAVPRWGAESLLGLGPFRWLGKLSYSLYLWHWPILIIAAEQVGKTNLPVGVNLLLLLVALAASMVTYRVVENPVRHLKVPSLPSVAAGISLVIATVVLLSMVIAFETVGPTEYRVIPAPNTQAVLDEVAAATKISEVPGNIEPALSDAARDYVGFGGNLHYGCATPAAAPASNVRLCELGDAKSSNLMVVYGDSHALMWLPALEIIARTSHWRLIVLAKYFCPAGIVTVENPPGLGHVGSSYAACDSWHQWAVKTINELHPQLVVVTQESLYETPSVNGASSTFFSSQEWEAGMDGLFGSITVPGVREVVIGNIPVLSQSGPDCLAAHTKDVQLCSVSVQAATLPLNQAERAAASTSHARYVNPIPWFCSTICTAVIRYYSPYQDRYHVSGTYVKYLAIVLGRSLGVVPVR
jgi:hypothetical protein